MAVAGAIWGRGTRVMAVRWYGAVMTMWRGVLLIVAPACMAGCATPSYTVGVPVDGTLPDDHPRIYVAGKVHTPLIIDGKLDEAVWATAPRTELYLDIEGDHMPTPDWILVISASYCAAISCGELFFSVFIC